MELTNEQKRFNYMMLSRMQADCEYYLGFGARSTRRLYAGNEKDQISEMENVYNSFAAEEKPVWITWEDIQNYKKAMC